MDKPKPPVVVFLSKSSRGEWGENCTGIWYSWFCSYDVLLDRPALVVPPDMTEEQARAALWPDFTEDPDRDIDIAAVEQACKTWPAAVLVLVYEEAKRRMEEEHG